MVGPWIEVDALKIRLAAFFNTRKQEFSRFGSTVNQTFEAFVLAQVISWYRAKPGWIVILKNPWDDETAKGIFRLKFSTRGRPASYSYAHCKSPVQIRHQLRVATRHHKQGQRPSANVCLDVAIINDLDLEAFTTTDYLPNDELVSFGEAKHMSAFAELIASFVGMVHELQPRRLRRVRVGAWKKQNHEHPAPFLFVSGKLWYTAEGLVDTIRRRKLDMDIYWSASMLSAAIGLPTKPNS
jgi:hypothetical protein